MTTRNEKSDPNPDGDITENLPVASGSGDVRAMLDAVEKKKKNYTKHMKGGYNGICEYPS